MTTKTVAVPAYTQARLRLFPCSISKKPAIPAGTNWQDTAFDPLLDSCDLPDSYGVVLDDTIIVLDFDPVRGETQLEDLWRQFELPEIDTFVVRTGSGGYHIYFRKPGGIRVRGKVPRFPAIDIKTIGGYVIGAGSKHLSGRDYEIVQGSLADLKPIPEKLLEYLKVGSNVTLSSETEDRTVQCDINLETDDPQTKSRYCQYLRTVDTGIGSYVVACRGRELGLSKDAIFDLINEHLNPRWDIPIGADELRAKIHNAFEYAQETQGARSPQAAFADVEDIRPVLAEANNTGMVWDTRYDKRLDAFIKEGTFRNCLNQLRLMPSNDYPAPLYKILRFNSFANRIEFTRPAPWREEGEPLNQHPYLDDMDVLKAREHFANRGINAMSMTIYEACSVIAQDNAYNPVKNWLLSLKWDGMKRLDKMLVNFAGSPNTPYVREVTKNTMIAAVARALDPGCQHDHMLVLEGPQGTGKTSFVRTLGGEWFADVKIEPGSKDTIIRVQGRWIIEMSEMEVLKRADATALKAFLSRIEDVDRLPFGRLATTLPRRCIFIGTVNPGANGYLQDPTGNRRYWAVATTDIDIPGLVQARDQLFAEAVYRYKQNEVWYITSPEIEAVAKGEQSIRQMTDTWGDMIADYLEAPNLPEVLTTAVIAWQALNVTTARLDKFASARIATAMKDAGYIRKNIRQGERQIRGWVKDGVDVRDDLI